MLWYFWPLFPKLGENFIQLFSGHTADNKSSTLMTNRIFFGLGKPVEGGYCLPSVAIGDIAASRLPHDGRSSTS
jgi:hypothetical protein